jgi:hypothetical protein
MFTAALKTAEQKMLESTDFRDVSKFLTYLMRSETRMDAVGIAQAERAPARVVEWLKTASPNVATSSLNPFAIALDRFLASNAPRGTFDSMKGGMVQVPLRTRVMLNSSTITGSEVAEGQAKPVRRLSLSTLDTETSKFVAQIVLSKEVLQMAPELAARMIATSLPEATAKAVDAYFLGKLAGQEVGESSGEVNPTWAQVLDDITELLRNVATGEQSRLWLILTPRAAKYLARLATENAVTTLGWNGGTLMGLNAIASSQQASNRLTLADASAIIYADDGVEVRQSEVAAMEMLDNPTNAVDSVTATSMVLMFQTNCSALLAERRIAVRVVDTDSVASLTGAQWGIGSDSPVMP